MLWKTGCSNTSAQPILSFSSNYKHLDMKSLHSLETVNKYTKIYLISDFIYGLPIIEEGNFIFIL